MIKAILFDCDGVLMDTERLASKVNIELLAESGLPLTYEQSRRHLTGKSSDAVRQWLENHFEVELEDWHARQEEWQRRFRTGFEKMLPLMPGVNRMFEQLELPIAVVSNSGIDELHYKIETTGLDRFIPSHLRFSAQELNMPKPAPGSYLKAAEQLNIAPEHCIVIEDSVIGATAGLQAGMRVWGFTADSDEQALISTGVHQCFDHMNQLLNMVQQHNQQTVTNKR